MVTGYVGVCVCEYLHRIDETFLIWWFCFATFGRFGISLRKHRRQQVFLVVPYNPPWRVILGHITAPSSHLDIVIPMFWASFPAPHFVKRLVWLRYVHFWNCHRVGETFHLTLHITSLRLSSFRIPFKTRPPPSITPILLQSTFCVCVCILPAVYLSVVVRPFLTWMNWVPFGTFRNQLPSPHRRLVGLT